MPWLGVCRPWCPLSILNIKIYSLNPKMSYNWEKRQQTKDYNEWYNLRNNESYLIIPFQTVVTFRIATAGMSNVMAGHLFTGPAYIKGPTLFRCLCTDRVKEWLCSQALLIGTRSVPKGGEKYIINTVWHLQIRQYQYEMKYICHQSTKHLRLEKPKGQFFCSQLNSSSELSWWKFGWDLW